MMSSVAIEGVPIGGEQTAIRSAGSSSVYKYFHVSRNGHVYIIVQIQNKSSRRKGSVYIFEYEVKSVGEFIFKKFYVVKRMSGDEGGSAERHHSNMEDSFDSVNMESVQNHQFDRMSPSAQKMFDILFNTVVDPVEGREEDIQSIKTRMEMLMTKVQQMVPKHELVSSMEELNEKLLSAVDEKLDEKLSAMDEKLSAMDEKLSAVNEKFDGKYHEMDNRLCVLNREFNENSKKITNLIKKVEEEHEEVKCVFVCVYCKKTCQEKVELSNHQESCNAAEQSHDIHETVTRIKKLTDTKYYYACHHCDEYVSERRANMERHMQQCAKE